MNLGIAAAANLTVIYAAVLFYMVTKHSNVTNVKCAFTINALLSQNLFEYVKNTIRSWVCPKCGFSTFHTNSLLIN